jgi:hypothetical protein
MPLRFVWLVPAVLAAITGTVATIVVGLQEPDFRIYQPNVPFLVFRLAMVGVAVFLASPMRWLWFPAFLLLLLGAFLASMSVGVFYVPTMIAAGWVMARRLEESIG